jgi:hypothetical protein
MNVASPDLNLLVALDPRRQQAPLCADGAGTGRALDRPKRRAA